MTHLLHLDSSIRTDGSRSRTLSAHFADRWRDRYPGGTVTYRDLAADPVPHLDDTAFSANMVAAADRTLEQAEARELTERLTNEIIAADTIVIGLPLYNFGPPTTFKAWFDRIVVPETMGQLGGKQFVVVSASGGGYGPGTPREGWDHREPWFRHALTTLGVDDATFIYAELTLARESPTMIPLDLGDAEDESMADAISAIDVLISSNLTTAAS